ncbi:MAG: DEAD/DEAH box helicase, partial [Acidothermus sp.]|nr:DEAD/DEAH box helicase [Acidothermus sp.]
MREADRAVARSASSTSDPLALFSPLVRSWFADTYREPTAAQAEAWQAISRGDHTLVIAPTGSGKTLAAFLWSLDRLIRRASPGGRVLYVSPLRALAVDIERNLRGPLGEIRRRARASGIPAPDISLGVRTGDTPPSQRRALIRRPPDILITTPESLFLLLTSRAQEALRGVDVVIVDEVHALADNKRGAHLALSLERLEMVTGAPVQRIGLSATVRPVETVAEFLGGDRPVRVVHPPASKEFDVRVVVPVPDMTTPPPPPEPLDDEHRDADGYPARTTLWPHVVTRLADAIEAHRSTIVFTNSRRLAERLTAQLNRLAVRRGHSGEVARAHHGSVSREQRRLTEEMLKNGRIPAVVATSSLELGIDMGAVELVAQVEPPPSVSAAIQRFGRAGHQLGEISRGIVFPKHRSQLVPAAVIVDRMRRGEIETVRIPENPLDVLAQHVVAMAATAPRHPDELFRVVRRAAPYRRLTRTMFDSVVDLLLGRYASPHLASLRPRLILDEPTGTVSASREAARIALTNAGTIPDRGQYAVFLAGAEKPSRVGELDEEMVYESRVGTVFTLGSSSWRIVDIG